MRRFLTLVCLLCVAIPTGITLAGCTRNPGANYCNGLGYGLKNTDVASITLTPQTSGISLAFGQTQSVASPTANTCKGAQASVKSFTYGTTNNKLVDISPAGNICAGTWNRNTGGGIPDYTICSAPNPLPATSGIPYGTAYITASAYSVTSNPVAVYVHAQVTALNLQTTPAGSTTPAGPTTCFSQNAQANLDVMAYYRGTIGGVPGNVPLCAPTPNASNLPSCSTVIGTPSFSLSNGNIAKLDSTTNTITAQQPGSTSVTASVANSGSSAGYFAVCPPASITVTLANGTTSGTITQGVTQNLVTKVLDTHGNPITGLALEYQSTDPIDISVTSGGAITTNYPGTASVTAICQPGACNPAPTNVLGLAGTGLPLTSNPVTITTPGTASNYVWVGAPGQSQYFVPISLINGSVGSTVRLPYIPNSMMMDRIGSSLFFGSDHELMIYNTTSNALTRQDPTVPGVVLAVSPDGSQVLINDQARQLFYIYSTTGSVIATFGGVGNAAAWTPDSQTLYISDNASLNTSTASPSCGTPLITGHTDTMYVYNGGTGWATYPLPPNPLPVSQTPSCTTQPNTFFSTVMQTPAVTVPSVGAYMRGTSATDSHTWCPSGTVGDPTTGSSSILSYYPQVDTVSTATDVLTATTDGKHILGAAEAGGGITLSDIGVTVPTTICPGSGTSTLSGTSTSGTLLGTQSVGVSATSVNQVVSSPNSTLAFVTYNGTTSGTPLPYYVPAASGVGTMHNVTLMNGGVASTTETGPIAGAFSPDATYFFASTTGDNMLHYISIPKTFSATTPNPAPTDIQQASPNLPACALGSDGCLLQTAPASGIVPASVVVVKPRATT